MAKQGESSFNSGFNIENTLEVSGQKMLENFFDAEIATGSPDAITAIDKDKKEVKTPITKKVEKKTIVKKEDEEQEEEQEEVISSEELANNFLSSDEDENEDEQETEEDKKKDKVVDKKEENDEENDEEPKEKVSNIFSNFAKDLFQIGAFSKEEGEEEVEINSPEQFLARFNHEKKKGAMQMVDNFIGQFGEDYQQAFDAIYVKGVNPKDYFAVYNNIENFAELDLTKEENQVSIVKMYLKDLGHEADAIDKEAERIKNYGDLSGTAERFHKILIKREASKLEQLEQDKQKQLQLKQSNRQQYVQNVINVLNDKLKTSEFDGIPINPTLAKELQDFLITEKYKTPSGEALTDFDKMILDLKRPENHANKVKIGLLLKILQKDPNLSTIQKLGVSKKSNNLFSTVIKSDKKDKKVETGRKNIFSNL